MSTHYESSNNVVISANGNLNTLFVSDEADTALKTKIRGIIKGYTTDSLTDKIIGTERHVVAGITYSNFLTSMKYQNVLFVPSFRNGRFPKLMDANYETMQSNASQHMTPIINKHFNCSPNIYVPYPDGHTSLYQDLHLDFGVNIISSNGMYEMGADNYNVVPPEDVKFDAVFLAGFSIPEGTTYNAQDIKDDFASYCTEDFDLIDDFQDHNIRMEIRRGNPIPERPTRLTGTPKDVNDVLHYLGSNTVHENYGDDNFKTNIATQMTSILQKVIKVY
jgi:hypothetical protein|tara:strand:+ start:7302 stop:8132 length:831 start_codon:yes stop_codon:yes gene_type:complete